MEALTSNLPEILLSVLLVSAFAILCVTLQKVFEQMELFRGKWALLMAALISVLVVAGAALLLLLPSSAAETGHIRSISINYSLLPALAVAGTIILLQLFVIAAATTPDIAGEGSTEGPARDLAHKPAKPKSRGRRKKEDATEKESKEVGRTAGEAVKKSEGLS